MRPKLEGNKMLKLISVIMSALAIGFAFGYGVRDWMSRRRRKEVRKKFYQKYKHDALPPMTETMTGASRRELTIQELNERLSGIEDKIANTTLEIGAFRREAQIEFFATRELLRTKFEEPHHRDNGGRVLEHRMSGQP
jgi:hypothetical protein